MNVLLAAASFSSNISGIQRHAFNVVRCLLGQQDISSVHLVIAPWQRFLERSAGIAPDSRFSTHIANMERCSLGRNLWYYRELPLVARQLQADIVHLSYPMPVNSAAFACPTVVTLHDLYPYEIPGNFGFPKYLFNRSTLQQCLSNVDGIACVSEITLTRLRQYSSARVWHKATRVYNCVEPETVRGSDSPIPGWRNEPFLLSVAQHRRNKNIPLLIRTFHRLLRSGRVNAEMKLVVIGISGPETDKIHRLVNTLGLNRDVCFLEGVPESALQWCYAHCEAVVAPSITEGFGLPVAEALLAGCRIICSDIPAYREVGDGHCRFVSLGGDEEHNLAEAVVAALAEAKRPPISLPQFSASALGKQYMSLYRRLVSSVASVQNAGRSASIGRAPSESQSL